jgi:dihydrodipicolinate synthase/N-acetylneuraminate lyase
MIDGRRMFRGVVPAITTPFDSHGDVDHAFLARHAAWLVERGCAGLIALGSLGEGSTLTTAEKGAILRTLVASVLAPVIAGVAGLSTAQAVEVARDAERAGCLGIMVLPPYAYSTDWREMKAHVSAVMRAVRLPCMLYNNPIAYRTDFLPEHIAQLSAEHPNLVAVKESSGDVRRITAIRALPGEQLNVLVGMDDAVVEGISAGAVGWVAGLANALPDESLALFEAARRADHAKADALYRWFLPLLRLDTVPKFVQLIKLVQAEVGMGSARVRPPRLELEGPELAEALQLIRGSLRNRPCA